LVDAFPSQLSFPECTKQKLVLFGTHINVRLKLDFGPD
jgi:hypothetical protein